MKILFVVLFVLFTGCTTIPSDGVAVEQAAQEKVVNQESEIVVPNLKYPAENPDTYTPGDGWTLVWSDEFNDDLLDENIWTRQKLLFPYNNEYQQYTGDPDTAYVQDGYLILKASKKGEAIRRTGFTSARIISNPSGNDGTSSAEGKTFLYGKIAARIQLPYGKGIWPAFWMLGDNVSETGGDTVWPVCGEIDILEAGSNQAPGNGDGTITGALHHDPSPGNRIKKNQWILAGEKTLPNNELYAEKFHVFEIEWDEQKIIWRMDGDKWGEISISEETRDEFHKPFYVIFNIAVGGSYTQTPDETTPFPQYMYVDWIREYKK